jgi:alpha-1,3-glucosyltransferase
MAGPSPSPHKPRRRTTKKSGNGSGTDVVKEKTPRAEALVRAPAFPLAAFLWPARTSLSQWEVLPVILMVVGLFRWAAGLWGYSGKDEHLQLWPIMTPFANPKLAF